MTEDTRHNEDRVSAAHARLATRLAALAEEAAASPDITPDPLAELIEQAMRSPGGAYGGWLSSVAISLVDVATLRESEPERARALLETIRGAYDRAETATPSSRDAEAWRDRLAGLREVARWTLHRVEVDAALPKHATHARKMFQILGEAAAPFAAADLAVEMGVADTQVSRSGKSLFEAGLAQVFRVGSNAGGQPRRTWTLTPHGQHVYDEWTATGLAGVREGSRRQGMVR